MLKIKILSDLHNSRRNFFTYTDDGEDLVVLAGDIAEGTDGVEWALEYIPKEKKILYIPGNHEYYSEVYEDLNDQFHWYNEQDLNLHVMLDSHHIEDDVLFVGSTLWSDFNLHGNPEKAGVEWQAGLNDSRYISTRNCSKLMPSHFIGWNRHAINHIKHFAHKEGNFRKRVLLTHYAPPLSLAPMYQSNPLNPGFMTHIPEEDHKKFDLHIHGHTHNSFDYVYPWGTRVVCNPKGYGTENYYAFKPNLVIEV